MYLLCFVIKEAGSFGHSMKNAMVLTLLVYF